MKFIPVESFEIESKLSKEALLVALNSRIKPKKIFNLENDIKQFEGVLNSDGFKITRFITSRNAFLPVVCGKIVSTSTGSVTKIKMRFNYLVLLFLLIWATSPLGVVLYVGGREFLNGGPITMPQLVFSFFVFLISVLVMMSLPLFVFSREVKKQKGLLEKLVKEAEA